MKGVKMENPDGRIYDFLVEWLGLPWGTAVMSFVKTFVATFIGFLCAELAIFFVNPIWEVNALLSIFYAALVGAFSAILRTFWNWLVGRYNLKNLEK